MEYLATFPNQLQAMEYARALTRSGIPSRMMPRPRALEASGARVACITPSRWISC